MLQMQLDGFGMGSEIAVDLVAVFSVDPCHDVLHARREAQSGDALSTELGGEAQRTLDSDLVVAKVLVVEDFGNPLVRHFQV